MPGAAAGQARDLQTGRRIPRVRVVAAGLQGLPGADQVPEYVVKYAERIGANFGTASQFAALFPDAVIITPHRLHA